MCSDRFGNFCIVYALPAIWREQSSHHSSTTTSTASSRTAHFPHGGNFEAYSSWKESSQAIDIFETEFPYKKRWLSFRSLDFFFLKAFFLVFWCLYSSWAKYEFEIWGKGFIDSYPFNSFFLLSSHYFFFVYLLDYLFINCTVITSTCPTTRT